MTTTSGKKRKIVRSGISYRGILKKDIYPSINDSYAAAKDTDPLDFIVPWQISDNRKDQISY